MTHPYCPFCQPDPSRVFFRSDAVLALWDLYPVTPGHALIVPVRHVPTWFEATKTEQTELMSTLELVKAEVERRGQIDGWNIGVNVGAAAGQTVPHLHIHLIPRRTGDVADPRGGVRYVIPEHANYLRDAASPVYEVDADLDSDTYLTTGPDRPFLQRLELDLAAADGIDMAVAFVKPSGVERLMPHLSDLIQRGGRLRLLTGTYLGITDPDAIGRLLDLRTLFPRSQIELRAYERADVSFHPKAYVLANRARAGVAYVGSSNLSASALSDGVEWNYRLEQHREPRGYSSVILAFERLFSHPDTSPIDARWVAAYRDRRPVLGPPSVGAAEADIEVPEIVPVTEPNDVQREAMVALAAARAEGKRAGLVVMATGLGKTWLAAFDTARPEFGRLLFVAHREEILRQAFQTFRRIRPGASAGFYMGEEQLPDADLLFASVQTLGRQAHLDRFNPGAFDYIVVDEFHHASAPTYQRLITHFRPAFLLGLTATPNRTDGGDLLTLCQNNLVYECGLTSGIRRGLLSTFRYFGVPDDVDYRNIPWRSTRFDEQALTEAVATQARAANVLEQWRKHGGARTIGFCVSMRHADFMSEFFRSEGVRAVAVHSGPRSAPRALSLEQLADGKLQVVFAVDMFNEGVDVPAIDTVMMLRPTESQIVWLQQFGRGLRKFEGKCLSVIDYIGNHRSFLLKVRTLLDVQGGGDREVAAALARAQAGELDLPPGCEVTYELAAINLLQGLLRTGPQSAADVLGEYYRDFSARNGVRPTAAEAHRDGYQPRSLRPAHGSWLGYVAAVGGLSEAASAAFLAHRAFLEALEISPMTRGFKMAVLLAMLDREGLPGPGLTIDELVAAVRALGSRDSRVAADFGDPWRTDAELAKSLRDNPLAAWTRAGAAGRLPAFTLKDGRFTFHGDVPLDQRDALRQLVRELAEWRLEEYFGRRSDPAVADAIHLEIKQASGRPMAFLPNRDDHQGLPQGWVEVSIDGVPHQANFVKVALNVVRPSGSDENVWPKLLRGWFGSDAGAPGTRHRVELRQTGDGWLLRPVGVEGQPSSPVLWSRYAREQIPRFFGDVFSQAKWNVGFLPVPTAEPEALILLVTLDKDGMDRRFGYGDRFLDRQTFQWQSQNKTDQAGKHGRMICDHASLGISVHLFVRATKKIGSAAAPFVYCGLVTFDSWSGERPITVVWRLQQAVPDRLADDFGAT